MEVSHLKTFIDVMKVKSFAEVARLHNMDPSVVSRAVSSLEAELGVRLFQRTTRKISPTEQGQSFFERLEPLIEELERARQDLRHQGEAPSGTLRVTSSVSFGLLILIPLLDDFQKLYPDVKIELLMTDSVLDLVKERVDVAIRLGHLDDSSFIATKLAPLDYVVCASPSYLKNAAKIQKPSDLTKHNCLQFLLPEFFSGWKFKTKKSEKTEVIKVAGNVRVANALALRDLALLGAGVVLLPKILIRAEIQSGRLKVLLSAFDATATDFGANAWLMVPSRDFVPQKTKVFLEYVRSNMLKSPFNK